MKQNGFRPALALATMLLAGAGLPSAQAQTSAPSTNANKPAATETHGDWTVICREVPQEGKVCAMSQVVNNQEGQRMLAVELRPQRDGLSGFIVLPFGVAVTQGVHLQVDDKAERSVEFHTCLPVGCIVPLEFDNSAVKDLQKGKALNITARIATGGEAHGPLSLKGFTKAAERTRALMK
ncbi:invasion protein IalB [Pseudomonas duriflava]|uniref:Invasion protein IalB n=1 Tax=Pseudomonas duriflava TaxID=459528 RepID=A0A562QKT8_9PSED|nr:invasion associated locus B family protein [Pseudomonas duriflava]TWI57372.1 invasion protein IalB [Pseudomonas duriflava]